MSILERNKAPAKNSRGASLRILLSPKPQCSETYAEEMPHAYRRCPKKVFCDNVSTDRYDYAPKLTFHKCEDASILEHIFSI
jgi:hypothetical protein